MRTIAPARQLQVICDFSAMQMSSLHQPLDSRLVCSAQDSSSKMTSKVACPVPNSKEEHPSTQFSFL